MTRISQEGRLLALVCVLLSSPTGLTRPEIFASVPGYEDESDASIRKFERDKDSIRSLGLALETLGDPADSNNLNEARYRVSKSSFEWPANFQISKKQLQYLELAARAWDSPEMSRAANMAVTRLRALGLGLAEEIGSVVNARLVANDPVFSMLSYLISEGRTANFRYLKPDGHQSDRVVSPWLLRNIGGQFVLLALDHKDGQVKNFLVRRIVGKVTKSDQEFRPGQKSDFRDAELSLTEYILQNKALVRVAANTEAWVHFGLNEQQAAAGQMSAEIEINFMDLELLAEELVEFGGSVKVLSPVELQNEVVARSRRVVDLHA